MKIWHVIDTLGMGGAEVMVATLCRLQKEAGLSPAVHCLRGGPLAEKLAAGGIPVEAYGTNSLAQFGLRLRTRLRAERPDVVHCHNGGATIAGAPAAAAAGIRAVITTRHGLVAPGSHFRGELKFWLAARFCRRVVAVCEAARRNLAAGPLAVLEKLVTIYNGAAPASGEADGAAMGGPGDFTILNVARHCKEKDLATLLRAFALARREAPLLRLLLAGDGALTGELQKLAEELGLATSVDFLGERRDVGRLLAGAKLFVLSSVSEGLPISLLEAMAAGVPQVVTDVGGMPEVMGLSRGGLVVAPGRPDTLAEAMLRFARDENLRQEYGERSRACYRRLFTPEQMAGAYLNLYKQGTVEDRSLTVAAL